MKRASAPLCIVLAAGMTGIGAAAARAQANLVRNPSFESGTANWSLKDYGSTIVSSPTHSGTKALKLINDFTGAKAPSHDTVQRVTSLTPGKEYEYSMWVRGDNVQGIGAGGKPMGMLTWKNSSGGTVRRWLNLHAPYGTYAWRQMACRCEAPPGAVQCDVYVRSWWDCTGGVTYWDDFELKERDFSDRGALLATYQAESADVKSQCAASTQYAGYTGSGYLVPQSSTSYMQWNNVNAGGGDRILVIRYSFEGGGSSKWTLLVNGVSQGSQITAAVTASPDGWATESWKARLNAGDNTVQFKASKSLVGPWIDKLEVYAPADGPGPSVPAAPTQLNAVPQSSSSVRLSWTDKSSNESGFKLDRRASGTTAWIRVAQTGANVTAYTDSGLTAGTKYYYQVKAFNTAGDSDYSNTADATTPADLPPPAAPSGCAAAVQSSTAIRVTWADNSNNETGFKLDRRQSGTTEWVRIALPAANATACTDAGLTAGTKYYYQVKATNLAGDSDYSNIADATTPAELSPPAAPSGCAAAAQSSTAIRVTWADNSNNETGFKLDRRQSGTTEWVRVAQPAANATAHADGGLAPDTKYYYQIKAFNEAGNSEYSDIAFAVTPDDSTQTVQVRVSSSGKDAEENATTGAMSLTSTDLEMTSDHGTRQLVGLRFGDVPVPQGALIQAAYLQFTADESHSEPTELTLHGEAADESITFSYATVSARARTTASVNWNPSPWAVGSAGAAQRTPNLAAVIQEVVSRPGWQNGNTLALIVTGTGTRVAVSYDKDPAQAALLSITYGSGTGQDDTGIVTNAGPDPVFPPGGDANGSGLDDAWEFQYFAGGIAAPDDDPDADGLSNIEEYIAGTDPQGEDDVLAVDISVAADGLAVTIPCRAAIGTAYEGQARYCRLESTTDGDDWIAVPGCERMACTQTDILYPLPQPLPAAMFFRACVWLEAQ
ncbi:MAG: fibronectin type III domain-containing protein [Kiritimatiellae bacterium]|nr:fibronectin type III domain-containing protein [Kiritimatiellia bacterium]